MKSWLSQQMPRDDFTSMPQISCFPGRAFAQKTLPEGRYLLSPLVELLKSGTNTG
jgi:hypothetical protein